MGLEFLPWTNFPAGLWVGDKMWREGGWGVSYRDLNPGRGYGAPKVGNQTEGTRSPMVREIVFEVHPKVWGWRGPFSPESTTAATHVALRVINDASVNCSLQPPPPPTATLFKPSPSLIDDNLLTPPRIIPFLMRYILWGPYLSTRELFADPPLTESPGHTRLFVAKCN